jgi:hypothetical protein
MRQMSDWGKISLRLRLGSPRHPGRGEHDPDHGRQADRSRGWQPPWPAGPRDRVQQAADADTQMPADRGLVRTAKRPGCRRSDMGPRTSAVAVLAPAQPARARSSAHVIDPSAATVAGATRRSEPA